MGKSQRRKRARRVSQKRMTPAATASASQNSVLEPVFLDLVVNRLQRKLQELRRLRLVSARDAPTAIFTTGGFFLRTRRRARGPASSERTTVGPMIEPSDRGAARRTT